MSSLLPPDPPRNLPVIGPIMIPAESIPDERAMTSFMSHLSRTGEYVLPRLLRVSAVMGQVEIDLTQVRIGPGVSEIQVRAVMGEVKIVVPHNLRVDCEGHPLLGEFRVKHIPKTIPSPDAPLLRITGYALMGSVSIRIVDPAAPSRLNWWGQLRAPDHFADEIDDDE